jgi:GNAT superfamily N-acetyltransferase
MLAIRPAIATDMPLLTTLIQELATYERDSTTVSEVRLLRDGFGAQPKFHVLLAEFEGQPAGYALFFDSYSSFRGPAIFLEDLFVRPQFRGKNVGRALFAQVARIATDANAFGVMFNVLNWNDSAIRFYRKIGATFLDDWKTLCLEKAALHKLAHEHWSS